MYLFLLEVPKVCQNAGVLHVLPCKCASGATENVLRACHFSTSELQKLVRECGVCAL